MLSRRFLAALAAASVAVALVVAAGALAASAPTVSGESSSAITNTGAALTASVDPGGQATTYAFEYGVSDNYTVQTAPQSAGAGSQPVPVSAQIGGLRPGTTYHYRVIATSAGGTSVGTDATFKTTGIQAPPAAVAQVATGPASATAVDGATLTGTINAAALPAGEALTYYFQLGTALPYTLQSLSQTLKAAAAPAAVTIPAKGLASASIYHYRLVAVSESGQVAVGPDQTFTTLPRERLHPAAVEFSASPTFQRRIPDRVTVSGRMVPPSGLTDQIACRGYFDITFRVGQIAVQSLRAGIHPDCTFSLPVVFHNRRRLMGGRVTVHVLFAGSRFLHRLEAPTKTIQVG